MSASLRPHIVMWDWTVADVVKATGLKYHTVWRALVRGELVGLHRGRLLRTNQEAVAAWLDSLKVQRARSAPAKPATPKRRGKVSGYTYFDPDSFGG